MKTVKDGFQMEDSNYIVFQNYQLVTTKKILYSVIKATAGGKNINLCSWAWTINVQTLNHIVVTEEQANNIQSKIKVSNAWF